jgi:hypothetical protein
MVRKLSHQKKDDEPTYPTSKCAISLLATGQADPDTLRSQIVPTQFLYEKRWWQAPTEKVDGAICENGKRRCRTRDGASRPQWEAGGSCTKSKTWPRPSCGTAKISRRWTIYDPLNSSTCTPMRHVNITRASNQSQSIVLKWQVQNSYIRVSIHNMFCYDTFRSFMFTNKIAGASVAFAISLQLLQNSASH